MSLRTGFSPTPTQMANLAKMARLGVENSAKGLSGMTNKQITMAAPMVTLAPLGDMQSILGRPEDIVVGACLYFTGDVSGYIALMLQSEGAFQLVEELLDLPAGSVDDLDDLARSALGEAVNIAGSFFLNATAASLGMLIMPSPPAVLVDMRGAILDVVLADIATEADEALVIETAILLESKQITGHFLVLPKPASLTTILQALE